MADTPVEYFSDERKKALDHLSSECFALEQLAKQYGHPEIQAALYRVRANELFHADTYLRGHIRREAAAGVPLPRSEPTPPRGNDGGEHA